MNFLTMSLLQKNGRRSKRNRNMKFSIPEFSIMMNILIFSLNIARPDHNDILARVTVCNRSQHEAPIVVAPTAWFRNNWKWGYNTYKAQLNASHDGSIDIAHDSISIRKLYSRNTNAQSVFCDNETNNSKLYGAPAGENTYFKDGINNYIIHQTNTINPAKKGTKASFLIDELIGAGESKVFEFRLCPAEADEPFEKFDEIFNTRQAEAEEFYKEIQNDTVNEDERNVQRQAFAGLLWNKQFYHYNIGKWLKGDPNFEAPRNFNEYVRNTEWNHLHNKDIISMPDKWEYPWYATWDLAFHCVPFSIIDAEFAKGQLFAPY